MTRKVCTKCKVEKEAETDFYTRKSRAEGGECTYRPMAICKTCYQLKVRAYEKRRRERYNAALESDEPFVAPVNAQKTKKKDPPKAPELVIGISLPRIETISLLDQKYGPDWWKKSAPTRSPC